MALLALANVPFALMPKIALVCNLLVVSGGCWIYYRQGYFVKRLILPFVLSSVPMAFLGGLYPIKEQAFMILLATSLLCASLRLLFVNKKTVLESKTPPLKISVAIGAALGFLSGMVGIGGGIFLSPLMLIFKWGKPKEVAATASAFIWLNSVAGLGGQIVKDSFSDSFSLGGIFDYFYLFAAVIIGGQMGSRIGTHSKVPHHVIQYGTAVLVFFISCRLFLKMF